MSKEWKIMNSELTSRFRTKSWTIYHKAGFFPGVLDGVFGIGMWNPRYVMMICRELRLEKISEEVLQMGGMQGVRGRVSEVRGQRGYSISIFLLNYWNFHIWENLMHISWNNQCSYEYRSLIHSWDVLLNAWPYIDAKQFSTQVLIYIYFPSTDEIL